MFQRLEEIHLLIKAIRKEKHISQAALGKGICSAQQISKIEKGETLPDFFLTEVLIQRLGKTLDKFEIVLSLEEYEEIEMRDDIIDDLRQGRPGQAEERLEKFCQDAGDDQPIRRMNRCRLQGVLALERGEYEAAEKHLEEAIRLTMGRVEHLVPEECLLAEIELETLILYARILWMRGKAPQARSLLEKVSDYVRKRVTDSEEEAKLRSKIAVVLGGIYSEAGEYAACAEVCGEALELLRDNDLAQCMPSLLALLAEAYERTGRQKEAGRMIRWRETLEQVYRHFGLESSIIDKLYFNACVSQYYLVGEMIREERRARGWSQEELIEGIYREPATLSRVENGQMPDREHLQQMLDKLSIGRQRYEGMVFTADYHVLELNAEIEKLMCRHEEEKAAQITNQLREYVDMSVPKNRQRVEELEICTRLRKGEMSPEEAYQKAEELLRLTYREGTARLPFRNELRLLNIESMCLKRMGRKKGAVSLQKKLIECFEKSRVQTKYHYRSVGLILDNMSLYLFHFGNIEESEEQSRKNGIYQLLNGKISAFHYVLSNFIGIEEDRAEKKAGGAVDFTSPEADRLYDGVRKKCLQYVNWAYHITDIFKQFFFQKLFIEYEKDNLGADTKRD